MAPHCRNAGGKKKKLSPDAFFAWLDEETFIDVKQPKKRRSTSAPPPPTGRKTYVKTNNHNPSLEVAADNELKKASKRINGTSNGTNGTASRCRSAATSEEDRRKLCETNKSSEKQKSLKKALAMGKRIGHMRQQEQQRFATEERLAAPSSIYGRKNLVISNNDSTCKKSSLEETLAIASQSHFMHFAADKNLKAPKKKRSNASLNDVPSRGRSKAVPSFWQQSSDEALASASAKGKRLRDNRRRKHQQYHHQWQQIEKEHLIDMKVRNTPLSGISSRTFDILPAGPLKHVGSYLTAISRVLFDVSLYGIDTKPCISDSSGVADRQWNILDFGEIERSLAYNLRDRHIKAILLRIDAVNKVKRLKLTNCLNITGAGLEPLRGSRIIEQIDLSIASNRWREWGVYPQIVYHDVVPILDSIIESEGCVLKHLQFPKVWWNDDDAFLTRYNEMLRNRGRICCFKCDQNSYPRVINVVREIRYFKIKGGWVQADTCSNCLNHFCHACLRNEEQRLRFCGSGCEKLYCSDCTTFNSCDVCKIKFCAGCGTFTDCCTSQCDRKICSDCISNNTCKKCNRTWCQRCVDSGPIELLCNNLVDWNSKQCTSCLSCADCGDTGDSLYLDSCTRCQKYLCES